MAKFNMGEAIHYQNIATKEGVAKHNFKVACSLCCQDPQCMWRSDCDRCKLAQIHREKLEELRNNARKAEEV